jgi:hypothetical protein
MKTALEWNTIQALKRKGILIHTTTWMKLEDFMLSEISQSHKDKYYMILLVRYL